VSAVTPPRAVRRIQRSSGFVPIDLGEIWRFRELLWIFMWRDVKARYKQTFLGPFWAVFRPFISMVLFSAIFGGLAGIKTGSSVPYPLFVYAGLLPWTYFASALSGASGSILSNSALISKAYFPRLYAPLSAVTAPLVDFVLALVIVFGLFPYYGRWPSWHIVFAPLFLLLAMFTALGIGLWLAGITVRYRDVGFALPFAVQIWMYVTPIIYPVSLVPHKYRWLLALNPLTAVVDGFRWSFFGTGAPGGGVLAASCGVAALLVVTGLFWYRRTERTIADAI
jgi:lipopolysaccharide transport system permease protein